MFRITRIPIILLYINAVLSFSVGLNELTELIEGFKDNSAKFVLHHLKAHEELSLVEGDSEAINRLKMTLLEKSCKYFPERVPWLDRESLPYLRRYLSDLKDSNAISPEDFSKYANWLENVAIYPNVSPDARLGTLTYDITCFQMHSGVNTDETRPFVSKISVNNANWLGNVVVHPGYSGYGSADSSNFCEHTLSDNGSKFILPKMSWLELPYVVFRCLVRHCCKRRINFDLYSKPSED